MSTRSASPIQLVVVVVVDLPYFSMIEDSHFLFSEANACGEWLFYCQLRCKVWIFRSFDLLCYVELCRSRLMWSGKRKVVVLLVKRFRIMYEIVAFSVHLSFNI